MIVYLAGPIDFDGKSAVNDHRHEIKKYFERFPRVWVYDPSKAWKGGPQPDQFVHWANIQVLEQADLLVAILMRNTLTVGTILEIQHARDLGIPVLVVGDVGEHSITLAALEVEVHESVASFDDFWVTEICDIAYFQKPVDRRDCECLAIHASHDNCNCTK